MVRRLLFDPGDRSTPSAAQVAWTWAVWLPAAALCFYVAWGYAGSGVDSLGNYGLEAVLVLGGAGVMVRPLTRTGRWLRQGQDES